MSTARGKVLPESVHPSTFAGGHEENRTGTLHSLCFFFFSSRRRHTRLQGDWSSDVCSSDLLDRAEEVSNTKHRTSLLGNREQILLSKQLVTIDTKRTIPVEWTAFKVQPPDRAVLMPLLKELEFTGLIKQYLPPDAGPFVEVVRTDLVPAVDDRVFFDIHEDRVSLWSGSGSISSVPLDRRVEALFSNPRIRKVTYDLKTALLRLRGRGIELFPPYDDPLLMAYLLFPNRGKYELPDVVFELTGQTVTEGDERTPWIERLFKEFSPRTAQEVSRPYTEIELPLSPVLVDMELSGLRIDVNVLERMSREMGAQLDDLTRKICEIADCDFNINSPRQLGEILFDKLNLPRPRKLRKSGQYSTAVEILEELAAEHELPRLVLEYRQLSKFTSTYVDVNFESWRYSSTNRGSSCSAASSSRISTAVEYWPDFRNLRGRGRFSLSNKISPSCRGELMLKSQSAISQILRVRSSNCAPISRDMRSRTDRKSTRLNSSHLVISYAVFCLKKKKN